MFRRVLTAVSALLLSALGSAAYSATIEPYSCRNGLFPSQGQDAELYRVISPAPVYFHDDDKGCPELAKCRKSSYIVKTDEVLVNKIQDGWACAWYQGKKSEFVGWIPADTLQKTSGAPFRKADWIGAWKGEASWIKIAKAQGAKLRITGFSSWSNGTTTNEGQLDGFIQPAGRSATMKDGDDTYSCVVELTRVGRYLIVSDNRNCGGMNVNFDDVYLKK